MTTTEHFQLELRGLLHGPDATWSVATIDGLGTAPLRTDDLPHPGRDGGDAGEDLWGPRTVVATFEIGSDVQADIDTATVELKQAWARSQEDVPLELWVEGGRRILYGRPRGAGTPYETVGRVRARCEFFAGDWRLYSTALRVAALPAETADGGVAWPVVWPAAWGASTSSIVDLANDGTADAPVVWTVEGPKTAPALVDVDRGVTLQLTGTVPDGSTLVVDTGKRTVELDGVDRWSWVTGDSGWPHVAAGGGRMRETSTAGAGTSSLAWRDAWN